MTESRAARALPAAGTWCAGAGLLAFATGGSSTTQPLGRTMALGVHTLGLFALVVGALAFVLLVAAWLRPDRRVIAGVATPLAALAAVFSAVAGRDLGGDLHSGGAPWIAGFGFAAAAVLALLTARRAE